MIRNVKTEDADDIRVICGQSLGHETTSELIGIRIGELADSDQYYIAVYEDEGTHTVSGFIQAERYDLLYGGKGWNIIALAVAPEAQRRGIGGQLLASLGEHAERTGSTFVRLNSNVVREDAHAFYESRGYICDKTQKRLIKQIV